MGGIYSIDGVTPIVHPDAFVHPDAVLVGDVRIDEGCYVGPLASLRGDFGRVHVKAGANVQDSCVLHCFPGRDCTVEEDGHIGHAVVLHGCTVGRGALVGIGAVIMDGVRVGARAFVGAASYVPADAILRDGWLYVGSPAREMRALTEDEISWKANGTRIYQQLAKRSIATLHPAIPLTGPEANRPGLSISTESAKPLREYRAERSGNHQT